MKDIEKCNNLITVRQMNILILCTTISPIIRIISNYCTEIAKQAVWVSVLVTLPLFYLFLSIINSLFKNNPGKSLSDIIKMILGNTLGKIVLFIYAFVIFFYFSFDLRILR